MPGTNSPVAPDATVVQDYTAVCYQDERGRKLICVCVRGIDNLAHIAYWDGNQWRAMGTPDSTTFAVDGKEGEGRVIIHTSHSSEPRA
jgi:hypothetical protein